MPFVTLQDTKDQTFDYVLVGGGTAGLTLAARLTEDADVSVLVLEAGGEHLGDPAVDRPFSSSVMQMGNPKYDWLHKTTPQEHAQGKEYIWHRGKGLGGSSAMNFQVFIPPPAFDIDYWEKLGNPGWNFENYQRYINRATSYRATSRDRDLPDDVAVLREDSGAGPVKMSYPLILLDMEFKIQKTLLSMGVPKAKAPISGDPHGTHFYLDSIDPETHTRSYAAPAYYVPNASRPNFRVLLGAYACRLLTKNDGEYLTATGVEFTFGDDSRDIHVVHARKEVLLCAGALKSPQILELSGIGRPDILESIGVPVKLVLEGVGENVQEHTYVSVSFQLKDSVSDETFDVLRDPEQAVKHVGLHPNGKGVFNIGLIGMTFLPLDTISENAEKFFEIERAFIKDGVASGKISPHLMEQYDIQLQRIAEKRASCELAVFPGFMTPDVPDPTKKYAGMPVFVNHPFSRGTIHCTSKDPHVDPAYDPHYFEHDIDLQTLVELVKFTRKAAERAPFKDILESTRGVRPDPELQTDEQLREWVKEHASTAFHTAGPLSMLPREKGGVVDSRLKVYGTTNIRVVDMSIVPLHFAGHSQAVAYMIGEMGADIVKGLI